MKPVISKRERAKMLTGDSTMSERGADRPLTVGELTLRITELLEHGIGRIWVEGEISNYRSPASGHAYFFLKDEEAALHGVCFRYNLGRLGSELADGKKVEVYGRVTAYGARSEYQIIVERAREAGLGDLMRRFIELRDRLKAEGLFDEKRKKPLPKLPRTIGIVTSATGAALRDMLNVIDRRASGLTIIVSPCAVQGTAAPDEIVRAIARLERQGQAEVIIAGRGGGSIEDLWAFNDERVARAIADCAIPIVSAVGHETDTTLSDFAADQRAPTPSAAAEIVTANYDKLAETVEAWHAALDRSMRRQLRAWRDSFQSIVNSWGMRRTPDRLEQAIQRTDDLTQRLDRAIRGSIDDQRSRLREGLHELDRASPERKIDHVQARLGSLQGQLDASRPDRRWEHRIELARSQTRQFGRRMEQATRRNLAEPAQRLRALAAQLHALGPDQVLGRGYSIITNLSGRRIVTGPDQARLGEKLNVRSAGGAWRVARTTDEDELFDNV